MMALQNKYIIAAVLSVLVLLSVSVAQSENIKINKNARCVECGMYCPVDSLFTSVIQHNDKTLYFCDIGDLLIHRKYNKSLRESRGYVRDYESSEWVECRDAHYIKNKSIITPMMWGIVAFDNAKNAGKHGEVFNFNQIMKSMP